MYREEDSQSPLEISSRAEVLKFWCGSEPPGELVKSIFTQSTPRWPDLVGLQPDLHTPLVKQLLEFLNSCGE